MKTYIKPADVHAPKRLWSLIQVLFDGGPDSNALAIGRWEATPVLAMRWNGNKENPLGNPQSRGLPTWFIVPDQYWRQILETEPFKSVRGDAMTLARNFLERKRVYFLSACRNVKCPYYLGPVLHSFKTNEIEETLDQLDRDELKFYHIICDGNWKPNQQEKADLTGLLRASQIGSPVSI